MSDKVKWVRLGDYIEKSDEINSERRFGIEDIRGVSNTKEFIQTKADVTGRDLLPFQIVKVCFDLHSPQPVCERSC